MSWTMEQVTALAPDSASVSAAQKLSQTKNWSLLAHNHAEAIWGLCQGSGAKPYQTRIDISGPAFKCSCPSRKFPCKHALALWFLLLQQPSAFSPATEAPDWVAEWLASRESKAAAAENAAKKPAILDSQAQAKRQQQRSQRVEQGISELQRWLDDAMRLGLTPLQHQDYAYWSNLRARLIDAQAPGLAHRIAELGEQLMAGASTQSLAQQLGQLQLLLSSYRQLERWPQPLQAEIRSQIGWSQSQDSLLQQTPLIDQWLVLQHQQSTQDRLIQQRIWCWGLESGRPLQILNFAPENQRHSLLQGWLPGQRMRAAAYFYPSSTPLRALLTDARLDQDSVALLQITASSLSQMRDQYQQLLLANPWLGHYPFYVSGRIVLHQGQAFLQQLDDAQAWPLQQSPWSLLALTASQPSQFMLLWNGDELQILGVQSPYSGRQGFCWLQPDGTLAV